MKSAIGIDIGGTKIACALVDTKGSVRKKILFSTGKNKKKILSNLCEAISLLFEGNSKDILGIGVGIPGVKDSKDRILRLPNLKVLNGFDLKRFLNKKFHKKIILENDASCSALGEYKFGAGKNAKSMFALTLGTGIGGGMIINGKLYSGRGNAPEPGHMLILGTEWEKIKLIEHGKKKYSQFLGIGLSNIIKMYDPEIIVLTGGVVKYKDKFLTKAVQIAKKNTFFPVGRICISRFPEDSGVIGAATLCF